MQTTTASTYIGAALTSSGQMLNRVYNASAIKPGLNPQCAQAVIEDPNDLCVFTNYSFIGAPSGSWLKGAPVRSEGMAQTGLPGGMSRPRAAQSAALAGWTPCGASAASPRSPALNMTILALSTNRSGDTGLVEYDMYYAPASASATCSAGMGNTYAMPVFYKSSGRIMVCGTGDFFTPCYYYCSDLEFDSLEAGSALDVHGEPMSRYGGASGPYNFASLYSTFILELYNQNFGKDADVVYRSSHIDLADAESIQIGIWLKTNGRNTKTIDCSKI